MRGFVVSVGLVVGVLEVEVLLEIHMLMNTIIIISNDTTILFIESHLGV
ncbi:hypothetical protein TSIB_2004 [Thermococcus sibiricus MM 739]|uniref:Uncharacterized protein n=1 Tax=Thermococcus sibiricus (strain DSM 12597 / MM 739) TaxID=604354 RepID=C6A070_THESM|nr:hypothetical protein TSIB_2004 [Thermococcus sibiricus MM 739]